ncbi:hypothetical protein BWQ96_05390 [Gracilariopsis chorda]|uniref:DNA/RNA-binding protein Alba-like domain-containing protein n=1 Tax=Gracilariopsis chorda TaxID=448386 RepID=A0A2V3IUT8_9FLOR|nr:hypothetical protein BWQ96_05390 [Gracilariopsis chorda]|eukprot:PXF44900.1 hypothetical protein BWQ96_05390 [Gracilariopsis chorda]
MRPEDDRDIVVKPSGRLYNYIEYATRVLARDTVDYVQFIAVGKAISKAVTLAEILKRNNTTLRQKCTLDSVEPSNTPRLVIQMQKSLTHDNETAETNSQQ